MSAPEPKVDVGLIKFSATKKEMKFIERIVQRALYMAEEL